MCEQANGIHHSIRSDPSAASNEAHSTEPMVHNNLGESPPYIMEWRSLRWAEAD